MNQLIFPVLTMSSRDIAELTGKRHDNVMTVIRDLIEDHILTSEIQELDYIHRGNTYKQFLLNKRDSLILVARLSPEFTAQIVDRWQELEQQSKQKAVDLNNPHALRKALLEYTEQVIELEHKNIGLERSIQTITQTPTGVKFQQACKILNIKRQVLADWLRSHGWDRRLQNARASTHYSQERGYCETKYEERTKIKANGDLGSYSQIEFFILPKGMEVLAKHFGIRA